MYIRSKCDGLQDEYAKIKTYNEFTPKSSTVVYCLHDDNSLAD